MRWCLFLKRGRNAFILNARSLGFCLSDFWRWSTSDLTNNAMRGILAEFLVARALEVKSDVRTEWDAYDLVTTDGLRIEVKSSAYVQTWKQQKLSSPCFQIGARRGWDASTNTYSESAGRCADVYVFALLPHTDKLTVDPMNLEQWTFYVLPTAVLNSRFSTAKSIGLKALISAGAVAASYGELAEVARRAAKGGIRASKANVSEL